MSPWARGRDEVAGYISQGEIDVVVSSSGLAARLLSDGERAVESARLIADVDPGGALTLAYDAARKAATSLLAAQGLRPTVKGGHRVVQDVAAAQFDGPFRAFGRVRRMRHDQQYPEQDSAPTTPDDAIEVADFAKQCIEASCELLDTGEITPWRA